MVSMAIEIVRAPLKIMFFHSYFPWSGWLVLTFFLLKPDPPNLRSGAKKAAFSRESPCTKFAKQWGCHWEEYGDIMAVSWEDRIIT